MLKKIIEYWNLREKWPFPGSMNKNTVYPFKNGRFWILHYLDSNLKKMINLLSYPKCGPKVELLKISVFYYPENIILCL